MATMTPPMAPRRERTNPTRTTTLFIHVTSFHGYFVILWMWYPRESPPEPIFSYWLRPGGLDTLPVSWVAYARLFRRALGSSVVILAETRFATIGLSPWPWRLAHKAWHRGYLPFVISDSGWMACCRSY